MQDARWSAAEIAQALGCGVSTASADEASEAAPAYFPPSFSHSPNTGEPLQKLPAGTGAWLSPAGSQHLTTGLIRGGKLTDLPLTLQKGYAETDPSPPREIKRPPPGRYRFLVGMFGLQMQTLLALDAMNGCIHCWVPSAETWVELSPDSSAGPTPYLGIERTEEQAEDWQVDAFALTGQTRLIWPCDLGLAFIRVDPLRMCYQVELAEIGACVSAPVIKNDKIFVLVAKDASTVLIEVLANAPSQSRELARDLPQARWRTALASQHDALWLSDQGQVVASPRRNQFIFVPWKPAGVHPQFELGPPYCGSDGRLWMQVLHPDTREGEGGPAYVSLGRANYDLHESSGLRVLSGHSSVSVERRLTEEPWLEPEVVTTTNADNDEAVIPIVESLKDGAMLVMRAPHVGSITDFLAKRDSVMTRFQVLGPASDLAMFYSMKLRKPWETNAFVYNGALYLSHPDLKSMPGWLLEA